MRRKPTIAKSAYSGKERLNLRCSKELKAKLTKKADERNQYINDYVIEYLGSGICPIDEKRNQKNLELALRHLSEGHKRLEISIECLAELFHLWMLQWFIHTPPVATSLKGQFSAEGKRRWEKFNAVVRNKLAQGHSALDAIQNDATSAEEEDTKEAV